MEEYYGVELPCLRAASESITEGRAGHGRMAMARRRGGAASANCHALC